MKTIPLNTIPVVSGRVAFSVSLIEAKDCTRMPNVTSYAFSRLPSYAVPRRATWTRFVCVDVAIGKNETQEFNLRSMVRRTLVIDRHFQHTPLAFNWKRQYAVFYHGRLRTANIQVSHRVIEVILINRPGMFNLRTYKHPTESDSVYSPSIVGLIYPEVITM